MCKFCEETNTLLSEDWHTTTGRKAFADVRFDTENNEIDMEYGLLEFDGSSGPDTTWSYGSIKIKYCPFCGVELSK